MPVRKRRLPAGFPGKLTGGGGKLEIVIDPRESAVKQHLILFHELAHLAERKLELAGIIRRRMSEERLTHFASALFAIVAGSGLWRGVSPQASIAFFNAAVRRAMRRRPRTAKAATRRGTPVAARRGRR
jgi:hypothetical protein